MKISFKGTFSPDQLYKLGVFVKEHLLDIILTDEPIHVYDCKIEKLGKYKILISS